MTTGAYRDISAARRVSAAACVERHLGELATVLNGAGLHYKMVEGSAVAAEVYLADTNTVHTAVRVAILVDTGRLSTIGRALRQAGFASAEPSGDAMLLRMASRNGRRAIHVLFEGDDAQDGGGERRHPGDPAARRERALRIGSAWLDLAAAYRRERHSARDEHDVTESFEVQLIALASNPA